MEQCLLDVGQNSNNREKRIIQIGGAPREMAKMAGDAAARGLRWVLIAGICGCASAPPRQEPPDPAASALAFEARRLDPAASGWDRSDWLNAALELNPALAEARARTLATVAAERTEAQRPNPRLTVLGGYVSGTGPAALAADASGWLYGLALEVLLQGGQAREAARLAAEQGSAIARAELAESIWNLRSRLREALLETLAAGEALRLHSQRVELQTAMTASVTQRVAAGDLAPAARLDSETALAEALAELRLAEAAVLRAESSLASSVGVPVLAVRGLAPSWEAWADIAALDSLGSSGRLELRGEALVARPDLVAALLTCERAETRLQAVYRERLAGFSLTPALTWDDESSEFELGLGLPLPVFHRHQGQIGEAQAQREVAARALIAVQAQAFAELERSERLWKQARAGWQGRIGSLALATRALAAEQAAEAAGASDRPTRLAAELAVIDARVRTLDATLAAQTAFARLESAYRRPLEGPETALAWRLQATPPGPVQSQLENRWPSGATAGPSADSPQDGARG